ILYLVTVFCFAIGIRMLRHPGTAANGNLISLAGMVFGLLGALLQPLEGAGENNYAWIVGSLVMGGVIGWPIAQRVTMAAMLPLGAMFNGLGGASATTIGIVVLIKVTSVTPGGSIIVSVLALVIGAVSFTGSVLAYLKLEGTLRKQWVVPMHNIWNVLLL